MKNFHIHDMPDSSVLALSDLREKVNLSPGYQRPGGVWSPKKKQLFIDSLLNGYDIPRLYFHHLTGKWAEAEHEYSIIDGRQRLEAIWDFIDGKFALSDDFKFFDNDEYNAAGMTFSEIQEKYPRLLIKLHARSLSVAVVTADDIDFIEDMFSRLNEAVPLNAAEKRNAFGGPLPKIFKELASHKFFETKVPFSATRYRYYDVAAKLLVQESAKDIVDTKRSRLDDFVKSNKNKSADSFADLINRTVKILDKMSNIFSDKDILLKSTGMVVVYFVLFSRYPNLDVSRPKLLAFEEARRANREAFEKEELGVNFSWIEYDELAQSANDGAAIKERVEILSNYLIV